MAGKYKCAVIGIGSRGTDWLKKLKRHNRCEVVAACDINETRLNRAKNDFKINVYRDYRDLFEKESLDFVVIATPHYLHARQTIEAAQHEVNVLCEKPMALNLKECDDMIIACRVNDVKLSIGFQHHYKPTVQYLKEAVEGKAGDNGSLGQITDIILMAKHYRGEMYYLGSTPVDPATGVPAGPWRGRWLTEGGGVLINQAIHDLDVFQYVGGPIRSVSAHIKTVSKEHKFIEVEDTVSASVEFENGALGALVLSSANKKALQSFIAIHGTDNYIHATGGGSYNFIKIDTRYNDEEDYDVPFYTEGWRLDPLENFIHALDEDEEPLVNGEEGRKSIELMRAIMLSAMNDGKRIYYPVVDNCQFPIIENIPRKTGEYFP